jgi:hypothetical protein
MVKINDFDHFKYRIRDGDESVIPNALTWVRQEMEYWLRAMQAKVGSHCTSVSVRFIFHLVLI